MRQTILLLITLAGCAHDVHARFPSTDGDATLVLRFTHAIRDAHVSVNGVPVVEGKHTGRITIDGIPPGETSVVLAAGDNYERAFVVNLSSGQRAVFPLATAGESVGRTLFQALLSAAVYAGYAALVSAL